MTDREAPSVLEDEQVAAEVRERLAAERRRVGGGLAEPVATSRLRPTEYVMEASGLPVRVGEANASLLVNVGTSTAVVVVLDEGVSRGPRREGQVATAAYLAFTPENRAIRLAAAQGYAEAVAAAVAAHAEDVRAAYGKLLVRVRQARADHGAEPAMPDRDPDV